MKRLNIAKSRCVASTLHLALPLTNPPHWGGRRKDAGRKPGEHPGLPHRHPTRLQEAARARDPPHAGRRPIAARACRSSARSERTFAGGCARPGFRLVHYYSLQGNHAHLIVEAHDRDALGRGMKAIGARLARAVNRVAGRSGRVLDGPLPSPPPTDAEGGAHRPALRAAECAAARGEGPCRGHGTCAARSGVVSALVRRLETWRRHADRRAGRAHEATGRTSSDLALDGRMAPSRPDRSRRTSRAERASPPNHARGKRIPRLPVHVHPKNSGAGRGVGGSSQIGRWRFRSPDFKHLARAYERQR